MPLPALGLGQQKPVCCDKYGERFRDYPKYSKRLCKILRITGAICVLYSQNHQPNCLVIGYIQRGARANMQSGKRFFLSQFAQTGLDLIFDIDIRKLGSSILCCFAQSGTSIKPISVAGGIGIQVGQRTTQCVQRVVEIGDALSRLYHTQTNTGSFNAAHRLSPHCGGTAQHNGPGNAPSSQLLPITRHRLILLVRYRVLAINLVAHDGVPSLVQIPNQFFAHIGYIQGDRAGHNHGTGVIAHPKFMDHRSH